MGKAGYKEAWWTGSMLANTPATPARGAIIGETFFFRQDSRSQQLNGWLSLISYGVTDRLALGVKPLFGMLRAGGDTSPPGVGDLTLLAQYRLTSPKVTPLKPTVAILVERSVPLGRHDRLERGSRPALGSGTPSTSLSLYAQQSFVLPNQHLFRGRLNLSRTIAGSGSVAGASVYGTPPGFRGRAFPGDGATIILAGEYSITRRWAVALDLLYEHRWRGRVRGSADAQTPTDFNLPGSRYYGLAPAIEYNISSDVGLLAGTRFKFGSGSGRSSITPAFAVTFGFRP